MIFEEIRDSPQQRISEQVVKVIFEDIRDSPQQRISEQVVKVISEESQISSSLIFEQVVKVIFEEISSPAAHIRAGRGL